MATEVFDVPVVPATRDNTEKYGVFIGTDVPAGGPEIPFYRGAVEEGRNLPFEYHGTAVVRTARIHPRPGDVDWLERHGRLTQLFVGLGDAPMAMVLGQPTAGPTPDLASVVAFVFPPGHGIMLHKGTWHDFPLALDRPVTVLVMNSAEVVEALAAQKTPAEMDRCDVYKIAVANRLGRTVRVSL
jgi:ureidoglycolate lyase